MELLKHMFHKLNHPFVIRRRYLLPTLLFNLMKKQGMWKDMEGITEVKVNRGDLTL
jgi:hypothetical protein